MNTKLAFAVFASMLGVAAAQQPRAGTSKQPSRVPKSYTASAILAENRSAVGVIVAAGNNNAKLGTGVFVNGTGLMLTNFHVVDGTDAVAVQMSDGSVRAVSSARAYDVDNDLVLLQVDMRQSIPSVLGDSDRIVVGEPIVVISNPEGLEQTVTNGLVSGIRSLGGRTLLQISAPISSGSSGGPVYNMRGEVIGLAVASLETGQNLNFAVPINYSRPLLLSKMTIPITALPRPKARLDNQRGQDSDKPSEGDQQKKAGGPP
ncbi:MAG: trypsin-like peptidase domain-containing protein [Candidatus Koribacter versatilis]|uniref:Trypsin-like peptidase domain-containing protein n=1 Tax=Candidatus Korobacter versatilis TaxID=658062 RepID=A0A932EQZ3_9BACT|nr:trypsin-like peptidase domain-containing protein [Candidatus Koribacter versatilis]